MGGHKFTNTGTGSARTDSLNLGQAQDSGFTWLTSVSGADTITADATPPITAYAAGQVFRFASAGANTGAVTLDLNSVGAKSVTKNGTTALAAGDIPSGAVCEVVYDGTQFQLIALGLPLSGGTLAGALNAAATATVASATTCDIGAAASNSVIISGTTTITGLGTIAAGAVRDVTFSGALTLTHNATSLILPTGANITTAAGDTASFVSLGSGNWRCLSYQKASGLPVAGVFGAGQTRQDLTSSRANGTTYTNSTGRPILISVRGTAAGIASIVATVGTFTGATATAGSAGTQMSVEFLVMSGETYKVDITNVGSVQWLEVR